MPVVEPNVAEEFEPARSGAIEEMRGTELDGSGNKRSVRCTTVA